MSKEQTAASPMGLACFQHPSVGMQKKAAVELAKPMEIQVGMKTHKTHYYDEDDIAAERERWQKKIDGLTQAEARIAELKNEEAACKTCTNYNCKHRVCSLYEKKVSK